MRARYLLSTTLLILLLPISLKTYASGESDILSQLHDIEKSTGGRLGISAIDTENDRRIAYHAEERFPMGCTSKVMGVAAILKKSMDNPSLLDKHIQYHSKDKTEWMPITKKYIKDGMSIEALSQAAISHSDNTAMNLLVKELGGIEKLNHYARSIGDIDFRQDYDWPKEAYSSPFDQTDSTTPLAMEKSLRKMIIGDGLAPKQQALLKTWLIQNVTGDGRIRAGVPKNWVVGDKTGTGFHYGTTNDIAIIWPPSCKPIVIVAYYSANQKNAPKREDILASATQKILHAFGTSNTCIRNALNAAGV